MASYSSSLILSLIDKVSAPSKAISQALDGVYAAQNRNNRAIAATRGQLIDATAMGVGLVAALKSPTQAAIGFEDRLEDIGQKADIVVENLGAMGKQVRQVGKDTFQSASEIANGLDVLTGMGASKDDALTLLTPIGRAATAYKANIADLSQAGYAALDNLKVPANEFSKALDAMAQAGKAGAFELKDMAQYFPTLGAGYQALGQTGVPAVADLSAALQIVRKGTGDSASAATNLNNVLQKINAPLTKANFAKMGVDLESEMKKATENGLTPIEAIAEITNKTLGGDLGNLGDLFNDAQVQQGLRPLIQNIAEYRKIRQEALSAQGVVEADYQRRLQTSGAQAKRFSLALQDLNLTIGTALTPALKGLGDVIVPIITSFATFAEQNPQLTRVIIATTAAIIGLRVASIANRFAFLQMTATVLTSRAALLRFSQTALIAGSKSLKLLRVGLLAASISFSGLFATAIPIVTGLAGTIGTAFATIGGVLAGITAPVWGIIAAIIAAIAAVAIAVYKYWVPISRFIKGFASGIITAFSRIISTIRNFIGQAMAFAKAKIFNFLEMLGIDPVKVQAGIAAIWATITGFGTSVVNWFKALPGQIGNWLSGIFTQNQYSDEESANFENMGKNLATSLWNGLLTLGNFLIGLPSFIVEKIGDLAKIGVDTGINFANGIWDGIKSIMGQIVDYIKNTIGNAFSSVKNTIMGWFGGGDDEEIAPALAGARARGGPVLSNKTYLVGENGPELFTPKLSGMIHNANKTASLFNQARSFNIPQAQNNNGGPAAHVNLGGITVNVNNAQNLNETALAQKISLMIGNEVQKASNAAFSDGVY